MAKNRTKIVGALGYVDPASALSFVSTKVTTLTFNGNQTHLEGVGKVGRTKVGFAVDAIDNGTPGTLDFFSIRLSNGYSASGNLFSGDIQIF